MDSATETGLTIQQASALLGLSAHTLRYYERAELLMPIERNDGGHRRYRRRDLDVLRFLMRLRETGMPIHQVRQYARLAEGGPETVAERLAMLTQHREAVLHQIESLQRNLAVVDFKIDLYDQGWSFTTEDDPKLVELRQIMQTHQSDPIVCLPPNHKGTS